jgi:hypothetical protein
MKVLEDLVAVVEGIMKDVMQYKRDKRGRKSSIMMIFSPT